MYNDLIIMQLCNYLQRPKLFTIYTMTELIMMKNYAESVESYHNPKWPYTPDHPYWILIFGGSGSGKTNVLLNLMKHQRPDINKVFF